MTSMGWIYEEKSRFVLTISGQITALPLVTDCSSGMFAIHDEPKFRLRASDGLETRLGTG
jgi:hypothetical protein